MKKGNSVLMEEKGFKFPEGACYASPPSRCADCRFINMGSMDSAGKCHCSEMGRWVRPSDPACHYAKW